MKLLDGRTCGKTGCLNHITHPCEACGRIAGMRFDHDLKTHPEFFKAIKNGYKNFEIRKNDRGFKVGDVLLLREFDPKEDSYSDEMIFADVTYITDFGQPKGQVVMALRIRWRIVK